MKKEGDEMNEHVRVTKDITSDHPVPVPVDSFHFDVHKRRNGYNQPYRIQHIESYAADFASGGVRRHISGSDNDNQNGHEINVAVDTMESAAFFKETI